MQPTSLAVTPAAFAPVAPALTLAADTRSVRCARKEVNVSGTSLVDVGVLKRARALFAESTVAEGIALNLSVNLMGAAPLVHEAEGTETPSDSSSKRLGALLRATSVIMSRLGDVLAQLNEMHWLQDLRLQQDGEPDAPFTRYLELSIRGFHMFVGGLMDNVSLLALQLDGPLKRKGQEKPPGFADIDGTSQRSCRESIPSSVLEVIDRTPRWWHPMKAVRNALLHRDHYLILFGHPEDGILFQVYDPRLVPKLADPLLLWPPGHNVLDFSAYSAFVMSELLVFLHDLGNAANDYLGVGEERPGVIVGGWGYDRLMGAIDSLIVSAQDSSERT